ncbi:acyl-CoA dehydrogenase family protein [Rudanella paleaurantiibacter]|nr:acyl-CoA dehydrogenase [Rudanella paleaurantiibacter]
MQPYLDPDSATVIRNQAGASEEAGQLHPQVLNLIYTQKLFKLYLPAHLGGIDIDLPSLLGLLEAVAEADGSTGWVVTLCSGASWFAGFWPETLVREVFNRPDVCVTGSGAASGTATQTAGGYVVEGAWPYATGALHATHFTANCRILAPDGLPVLTESGQPLIRSFLFTADQVERLPTWSAVGMVGTGSHGFAVHRQTVSEERSFDINSPLQQTINVGNYPFLQLAEATLAVNFSGMARHFLALIGERVDSRLRSGAFTAEQARYVEQAMRAQRDLFMNHRGLFYEVVAESCRELDHSGEVTESTLRQVSNCSRQLAHTAREVVDRLFPYGGLETVKSGTELGRVWRDIHTASGHSLLTFPF